MAERELPPDLVERLQGLLGNIQPAASALKLWNDVLTPVEQEVLGGDLKKAYRAGGTLGMWLRLHRVSQPRAIVEVARELGYLDDRTSHRLLRRLNEDPANIEEAIASAAAQTPLVLVERPREAYWQGKLIEIDWSKRSALWDALWTLAEKGQRGGSVDRFDFGESRDTSFASKLISRLCNTQGFPGKLAGRIESAGRGSYRLQLEPGEICLFGIRVEETLHTLR